MIYYFYFFLPSLLENSSITKKKAKQTSENYKNTKKATYKNLFSFSRAFYIPPYLDAGSCILV